VVPGLLDGIGNVQRLARRIAGRPAARPVPLTGTGD
jgi:hypothetical protein